MNDPPLVTTFAAHAALRHLGEKLIADSLHGPPAPTEAALIRWRKSYTENAHGGNPFFAIQFVYAQPSFEEVGYVRSWRCTLVLGPDRIHAKGYTDNVGDLMVGMFEPLARRIPRS